MGAVCVAGCAPICTVKRESVICTVDDMSRSSRRVLLLVVGTVPNFPAKSVTAVFIALIEATAAVTRDDAIVEKTFGTMTTARIAMMARTPIISTKLKPDLCATRVDDERVIRDDMARD